MDRNKDKEEEEEPMNGTTGITIKEKVIEEEIKMETMSGEEIEEDSTMIVEGGIMIEDKEEANDQKEEEKEVGTEEEKEEKEANIAEEEEAVTTVAAIMAAGTTEISKTTKNKPYPRQSNKRNPKWLCQRQGNAGPNATSTSSE